MTDLDHSIYESAPTLLLDKIAEVNGILEKQKAKSGETESWKFWMAVREVMDFAWHYMDDVKWIFRKNAFLEIENKWLREWNMELSKRLRKYELIRELKMNGEFDEAVAKVDELMKKPDKSPEDV